VADEKTPSGATAEPPPIKAEIFVYVGNECVTKYSLTHGDYTIGRDVGAQVNLDVEGVSRHHARLSFQGYEIVIEDLASANGVFIEGVQVTLPTRLRPDQQVEIGSARLFVRLKEDASAMLAESLWDPNLGLAPIRTMLDGKKYKVIGTIATGGMGIVQQARDLRIRRQVAMKVIKTASQFSRENLLRFVEEAQLTGQLQHPNIVPVHDLALDDQGEVFYTMKFVKGTTLDAVLRGIRRGDEEIVARYPLAALLSVFQKICDGVAFAHSMGVVHRDLKPDNIMIGEYGEVLVLDWGLAKKIVHGVHGEHLGDTPDPLPEMRGFETVNGLIVGTPPYISPEAARGELELIDSRSDIYVLGGILYSILTLRPPYSGTEFGEIIERIVSGKFESPASFNQTPKRSTRPGPAGSAPAALPLVHLPGRRVPEGLAAVVVKAMSYEMGARYQTVADLQDDITAWQSGFPPKAERAGLRRQLFLWAGRHKTEVGLGILFFVAFNAAVVWFFFSVRSERDRLRLSEAEARTGEMRLAAAIQDLQGAAPLFADEARELVSKRDLDGALDRIESAIRQVPNDAHYHLLRGHILQTLLRWDDAVEAYESAIARNPKLSAAQENLQLTRRLLSEMGDADDPGVAQLENFRDGLVAQQRQAEAATVNALLGAPWSPAGKAFRELVESDPALAPLRGLLGRRDLRGRIRPLADGTFRANLGGLPLAVGLPIISVPAPISELVLDGVELPNLAMLRGMKLRALSLKGCRAVTDLEPLGGMPLQRLNLSGTGISDLGPVVRMPLIELQLLDCSRLADISALKRSNSIESLLLPPNAGDIGFLREMRSLKTLSYRNPAQTTSSFWREFDSK
jgi:serine/threonine protein kinase